MITAIIIEDERNARIALQQMIVEDCPEIKLIGEADDVETSIELIQSVKPDLVFLDIQLGHQNSFEILEKTNYRSYRIIFTTAYEHYAIKAFRFSAIDYLLKPINREYLRNAIDRLLLDKKVTDHAVKIETLLENLQPASQKPEKLILTTQEMISVVAVADIIRCEADVNYTRFIICGQPDLLISRTMKEFEEELQCCDFMRVHKSHLINIHHVKGFDKREGGSVVLSDGARVPLSVRKREVFMESLKKHVVLK